MSKRDELAYVPEDIHGEFRKIIKDTCRYFDLTYADLAELGGYASHTSFAQIMCLKARRFPVIQFYGYLRILETILTSYPNETEEKDDLLLRIDALSEKQYRYIKGVNSGNG